MPHFYGAVGAPKVGHHQWQPHSQRRLIVGNGHVNHVTRLFVYETRLFLHEIRWRPRPREYGVRITACVLAILIHMCVLLMMAMVRPPGYPPEAGEPEVSSIEVRLITPTKPPPPPPPIKLPKRPVKKAPRHVSVPVKRAPVAAMPPIPQVTPAKPEIKLTPSKPDIAKPQLQPQPMQQAAASPQVARPIPQVELSPTPPKVVLEKSKMAVPPPQIADVQMAPVEVPSPALQTVPTVRTAPTVELGNPKLAIDQPGAAAGVPQIPAHVEASTPEVPTVSTTAPSVHISVAQMSKPTIEAPAITLQATAAPTAELAPILQAPDTVTVSPTLDLPVAKVPVPQAPQVQMPSVHINMPSAAVETASQPASASSTRKASTAHVAKTSSWVPADDQFKPLTGHQGQSGASTHHASSKAGTVQLLPRGNSNVMTRNSDHLGYKPTIFDQYWAPANESLFDSFLRHIIEKFTVIHTFHLAPGVRVKCALGPMAIFLSCGNADAPRPKSRKSNDPRLNMAPARPLVPGLGTPSPAASSSVAPLNLDNSVKCSVARVAGGPPPPGCPNAPVKPSQSDQWK